MAVLLDEGVFLKEAREEGGLFPSNFRDTCLALFDDTMRLLAAERVSLGLRGDGVAGVVFLGVAFFMMDGGISVTDTLTFFKTTDGVFVRAILVADVLVVFFSLFFRLGGVLAWFGVGVFFDAFLLLDEGVFVGDGSLVLESALGVFCTLETGEAAVFSDAVDFFLGVFLDAGGVFSEDDEAFFLEGMAVFFAAGDTTFELMDAFFGEDVTGFSGTLAAFFWPRGRDLLLTN